MARRPHRGRQGSGTRRLTQWFRAADISSYTALAGATAVLDQSLQGLTEPVTVVRIRGSVSVQTDQVAASESPFGAIGACVVSDQALAIGITAVPQPISDADSDLWVMHQYFYCPVKLADATGFADVSQTVNFDSKAMRKIPEGSTLIWVIENASTVGLQYALQFAALIKLA